tara:strand:+ start:244 stop:489 length:246 start_codon:yes stop_codon:yes gene_type:complete
VKNDIGYGDVDITEELSKEVPKVRTTMFLDIELKNLLKSEAADKGIKYQQLIREILKSHFSEKESLEDRIKKLESIILKEA